MRQRIGTALMILACAGLVGFGAVLTAVCVSAGRAWTAQPADCIVVLGAHVQMDGRMSATLVRRCEAALAAWKGGLAPVILVSGGKGDDEPGAQADYMTAWLRERGVPEAAILREDASHNTLQNLRNAKAVMDEHGLATAALCTSDYHLRRALWLAGDVGLAATGGVPSASPQDAKSWVSSRLRETCSWALYFLRMKLGVL